jgi:hypothetical protein
MEHNTLWFKRKIFGWGWTPVTWEGWAVIAMYVVALVNLAMFAGNHARSGGEFLMHFFPTILVLTIFMTIICYAKGEKPKWQMGNQTKDTSHE